MSKVKCYHPSTGCAYCIDIPEFGIIYKREKLLLKTEKILEESGGVVGNEAYLCASCKSLIHTGKVMTIKTFFETEHFI